MTSEGLQRCFVLHRRPYSESSLILDVFSEEFGRVTLMSKGARSKRSNLKGALQPFTPLLLKWSGKGSMKTLRQAEPISLGLPLTGINLYSAMYVNELIGRVLMAEVSMPACFMITCMLLLNWLSVKIRNRHCAVLNWHCCLQWDMASTFSIARVLESRLNLR